MSATIDVSFAEKWTAMTQKSTPRPTSWEDVVGNEAAVDVLKEAIAVAQQQDRPVPHTMLTGNAGTGKTTMAKILAQSMGGKFIETTAATFERPLDVLRIIDDMNRGYEATGVPSVLFIDEIHTLGSAVGQQQAIKQESVYTLLEDWVFHHNLTGKKIPWITHNKCCGELNAIDSACPTCGEKIPACVFAGQQYSAWPFTAIGATTDIGMLNPALRRRFLLDVELEPYTEDHIAAILQGAAKRLSWAIDTDAAVELSKYCRRTPGRAYQLLTQVHNRAVASGRDITVPVVVEAVERLQLYHGGLTNVDVRALRALQERPMSKKQVSQAVGVSEGQYTEVVEPFLTLLGFVQIQHRRMITPKGLEYLSSLQT